jgi:hypothetical protein
MLFMLLMPCILIPIPGCVGCSGCVKLDAAVAFMPVVVVEGVSGTNDERL